MKISCVISLELPHRGDSIEYTQYIIFNIKKENHPRLSQICSYGIFPRDSMVNDPSTEGLLYVVLEEKTLFYIGNLTFSTSENTTFGVHE